MPDTERSRTRRTYGKTKQQKKWVEISFCAFDPVQVLGVFFFEKARFLLTFSRLSKEEHDVSVLSGMRG